MHTGIRYVVVTSCILLLLWLLSPGQAAERAELERWQGSQTIPALQARRARIILLAATGVSISRIAAMVGITYSVRKSLAQPWVWENNLMTGKL